MLTSKVVLLADAYADTCSSGDFGCLVIRLGIEDVATPVIAGETWFEVLEGIKIRFVGELLPGIGDRDIILHILGELKRNNVVASRIVVFSGL